MSIKIRGNENKKEWDLIDKIIKFMFSEGIEDPYKDTMKNRNKFVKHSKEKYAMVLSKVWHSNSLISLNELNIFYSMIQEMISRKEKLNEKKDVKDFHSQAISATEVQVNKRLGTNDNFEKKIGEGIMIEEVESYFLEEINKKFNLLKKLVHIQAVDQLEKDLENIRTELKELDFMNGMNNETPS